MTPAESFKALSDMAIRNKLCMVCRAGIKPNKTGRPRNLCKKKSCKTEYQSLYYNTHTKPDRQAEAKEKAEKKYESARLADEKSNVIKLADFFSSEADASF